MLIEVTQDHIDQGIQAAGANCPLALALRDSGFPYVHVGYEVGIIASTEIAQQQHCKHTLRSRQFVEDFDNGHKVQPSRFRLALNVT